MSILGAPEKPARRNALPAQSPENKKKLGKNFPSQFFLRRLVLWFLM